MTFFNIAKLLGKVQHPLYFLLQQAWLQRGDSPAAGLIADSNGNLYGTTKVGGGGSENKSSNSEKEEDMKKSWLPWPVVMAESRVGLFAIIAAITTPSQIMMPSNVWGADCKNTLIGCVPDGDCEGILQRCVLNPPNSIPPCKCEGNFLCSPGDAVLVNKQFPVPGEFTYNISSPTRILQSISLNASSNIGSFTLPIIQSDGHSATGGVFIKANSPLLATFELVVHFITPAFACNIDPATATLWIKTGHMAVEGFQMISKSEHFIEVDNGSPGLRWLRIDVNGKYYRSLGLTSGGTVSIDASAAMSLEENTLSFIGEGKRGTFANISLSDSAPASSSGNKKPAGAQETGNRGRLMFRF